MQAHEIGELDQGCTCSDWVANMPQLRNLLALGIVHGQHDRARTLGTPFRFCPWCGQRLERVTNQRDETLLQTHRQGIEDAFFAKDAWGVPQTPNMLVASRLITGYRQATGDLLGTLDLMLAFVEAGTRFTSEFGDIDEPFYEGLELMLADFQELLLAYPDLYEEGDLPERLVDLAEDAGWMGWGYGDYVRETATGIQQHFGDV